MNILKTAETNKDTSKSNNSAGFIISDLGVTLSHDDNIDMSTTGQITINGNSSALGNNGSSTLYSAQFDSKTNSIVLNFNGLTINSSEAVNSNAQDQSDVVTLKSENHLGGMIFNGHRIDANVGDKEHVSKSFTCPHNDLEHGDIHADTIQIGDQTYHGFLASNLSAEDLTVAGDFLPLPASFEEC